MQREELQDHFCETLLKSKPKITMRDILDDWENSLKTYRKSQMLDWESFETSIGQENRGIC